MAISSPPFLCKRGLLGSSDGNSKDDHNLNHAIFDYYGISHFNTILS